MAGEKKRFELRPVDEATNKPLPVIRLKNDESMHHKEPVRLETSAKEVKVSKRLELPTRVDVGIRTHQPGIDALFETIAVSPDLLEQEWGRDSTQHKTPPWGWFVLIAAVLAGAIIWSLTGVKTSVAKAQKLDATTQSVIGNDEKEAMEADRLIDKIQGVIRRFFDSTSVDVAVRYVRQPERVRLLMRDYYNGDRIPGNRHLRTRILQPITLDNRADFWMTTVELVNHDTRVVIIEIDANGEPRIDWETLVCYQPMKWDDYATRRPAGKSFDFRVYIERDHFFSHEFAHAEEWNCFRLTALDSDETLFGYAKVNDRVSQEILACLEQNQGQQASVIVRINIPENLQSRRGVVIEKFISPRWLYVAPPE